MLYGVRNPFIRMSSSTPRVTPEYSEICLCV
jgi:hypothetical protein